MDESLRIGVVAARRAIIEGALRGAALTDLLLGVPFIDRDAWISELLGIGLPPEDMPGLPRGAVPYLPCGVEEILACVRETPLCEKDQLVDLGSGLGKVVMLVHLLCGAEARGIEIQPLLVEQARARCAELRLSGVTFTQGNAADIELDGSHFFLYCPFNGQLLADVLAQLERVAQRRRIVICAVGFELRDVPWLAARPTSSPALWLYQSS